MENRVITKSELKNKLTEIGVVEGINLLVHCTIETIGQVENGIPTVIEALQECIGPQGVLIMPTFSDERFVAEKMVTTILKKLQPAVVMFQSISEKWMG